MNRAVLIGNLTKAPELRTTASGVSVCSFTVAVNRSFGDKKEVDYVPVVVWRALAENCAKYLAKGKKVGVSGRIQVRNYEANDGSKRYVTEVIADDVEFLSPKSDMGGSGTPDAFEQQGFEPTDEDMPF